MDFGYRVREMTLGLRIDVDTLFGLGRGVPHLLSLLDELDLKATFFVPMGPDRMGRNLKRVITDRGRRTSLVPYARTYHWRMLMNGTLHTPSSFTDAGARMMMSIARAGHEVGLHSFDHYGWQSDVLEYSAKDIERDFARGMEGFRRVFGILPACSAAPGWRTTESSLLAQDRLGLAYASDTRGLCPFYPSVGGRRLLTLQIPVSLPTLDELLLEGKEDLDIPDSEIHVYCAHAEVEGYARLRWFRRLLEENLSRGIMIVPLSALAGRSAGAPESAVHQGRVPGRAAEITLQADT